MSDLKIQGEVSLDTTNVDAAFARVEQGAGKMAQSVQHSGQQAGKGIEGIGAGGDKAAQSVEKAEKSIIASIQRATAMAQAGERGTVKYYEAIANAKGVTGDALKPYLAQLDAAIAKQKAAAGSLGAMGSAGNLMANKLGGIPGQLSGIVGSLSGMFVGLAGAMSLVSFGNMVNDAIKSAAALKQLSEQTGATVEGLSALKSVAKLSGTGIDQVATGLTKLSKNMMTMSDEGKEASRAIAAIGLDAEKLRRMKLDEAMLAIANAMAGYSDGAEKTAITLALFGKEGAKLKPMLNDLAVVGTLQAKVTKEQAAAAYEYEKNLVRLNASGEAWKKELAMGLLPTLDLAAKAMLDMLSGSNGLRDGVKELSADGSLTEWAEDALKVLAFVADAANGVVVTFKLMGNGLAASVASSQALLKGDFAQVKAIQDQAGKDTDALLTKQLIGSKFMAAFEARKAMKKEMDSYGPGFYDDVKSAPDFKARPTKTASTAEAKDPYEAIIKSARDWIAVAQLDLESRGNLTEAGKALAKMDAMTAEEQAKGTATSRALARAELERADSLQKLDQAKKAIAEYSLFDAKNLDALREEGKITNLNAISLAGYSEAKKYEAAITEKFYNVSVDANGELVKTPKYTDAATKATLENIEAHKQVAVALAEENAARKLNQQYQQEIAQLKIDNTIYFDDAARQVAMLEKEADARWKVVESMSAESKGRIEAEQNYAEWLKLSQQKIGTENLKEAWRSVDSVAHDAFASIFTGGKDTFTKLRDTLKTTLIDLLYQMTVKKWVFSIFADVSGANTVGGATGGAGLGGLSSLASTGNNAYNLFTGNSGGGLYNTFATSSVGQAIGLSTPVTESMIVGQEVGGLITGDVVGSKMVEAALPELTSLGSMIGTALPWVGGALALASLFGKDLFGKGGAPKSNYGTGFVGTATGAITNPAYGNTGVIGSGQALDGQSEFQKAIYTDAVQAIVAKYAPSAQYNTTLWGQINEKGKSSNQGFSRVADASGATIYQHNIESGKGSADFQKYAQEEIPRLQLAIVTDAFRSANADYKAIADSIVGTSTDLTSTISSLSADAATAMSTNLSGVVALFDQIKASINPQITGEATAAIVKLAGGFTTLSGQISAYYATYFSKGEQSAALTKQLSDQFAALNISMPSTKDQFRALVEGLDTTTESGQKTFAALMGLSGAFATVAEASEAAAKATADAAASAAAEAMQKAAEAAKAHAEKVASEAASLQNQLDEALGNTAAIRARELAAIDPANQALQLYIWSLQDAATAASQAAAATDSAYSALEKSIGAEKDKQNAAYDAQVSALDAQYQAVKDSFAAQRDAAQEGLSAIVKVADTIRGALKSLTVESDTQLRQQRQNASQLLQSALTYSNAGGSLKNFSGLDEALATAAKPAQQLYGDFVSYAREQGRIAATVAGLGKNANAQVSVAQMTLDAINASAKQADAQYQAQKIDLAKKHREDLEALDALLNQAKDQLDALNGINNSVLSVGTALSQFAAAVAARGSGGWGGGGGSGGGTTTTTAAPSGNFSNFPWVPSADAGSAGGAATAKETPIADDLRAELDKLMSYNELVFKYGEAWADGATNDPSGNLWRQAVMNKQYNNGIDMNMSDMQKIFGAVGSQTTAVQNFMDALSADQWDTVKASADPLAAFGKILNEKMGLYAAKQDDNHTGIFDKNGFLIANTTNDGIGMNGLTPSGAPAWRMGKEWGIGLDQLPGGVVQAGAQATVASYNDLAERLKTAPSSTAIEMLYSTILGRQVDSAGAGYWAQKLNSGFDTKQMAQELMRSDEYMKAHGFGNLADTTVDTSSLAPSTALPAATTTVKSAIETLYENLLGRQADSGGADYWSQQLASGMSTDQIAQALMGSEEYKKIHGFAAGGLASAGLYLAGEKGPELIQADTATQIYPAEQTAALMARLRDPGENSAVLAAKLDAVVEALDLLRAENRAVVNNTRRTAQAIDRAMPDGDALAVRATA